MASSSCLITAPVETDARRIIRGRANRSGTPARSFDPAAFSMAPYRAGGAGSICAQLKFVSQQRLHAAIIHYHHNQSAAWGPIWKPMLPPVVVGGTKWGHSANVRPVSIPRPCGLIDDKTRREAAKAPRQCTLLDKESLQEYRYPALP